jgi:pimeloyl-ACP methyl ester carboxylesterase
MTAGSRNSTIVRSAQRAADLWFTVPPPIDLDRLPALPPGEDVGIELDGRPLHAVTWGGGTPVYLVHGWGGRAEQLGAFVAPLVAAGHRVVAFDAPAHGRSVPGRLGARRGSIPEFAAALRAAVAAQGEPHAVIAHSLGGAATAFAISDGLPVSRLVLVASPSDPLSMLSAFADHLGLGACERAELNREVARRAGYPLAAFDLPAMAGAVALPPTLVVHDRHDREVAFEHGAAVAESWPGARLLATKGLGHQKLMRDQEVIGAVVTFLTGNETARRSA